MKPSKVVIDKVQLKGPSPGIQDEKIKSQKTKHNKAEKWKCNIPSHPLYSKRHLKGLARGFKTPTQVKNTYHGVK